MKFIYNRAKLKDGVINIVVSGIICEYNPFHKGHEYHIRKTRDAGADFIICIMSGAFVQRGTPAILDKWSRAYAALTGGADMVIELPSVYAVSPAEMFAFGAVSLLDKLNVCTHLSFGSLHDASELLDIARLLLDEPSEFKEALSVNLSRGLSYPSALAIALSEYTNNPQTHQILADSNNVLGIEYIRAILKINSKIKPQTVKRIGSMHNDTSIGEFSSSTAIRKALSEGDYSAAFSSMPDYSAAILRDLIENGRVFSPKEYELICLYALRRADADYLACLADVAEGLENRLKAFAKCSTLEDVISGVKSKRYTRARITRLITYCVLGLTQKLLADCGYANGPGYARVLGYKKSACALIDMIKEKSSVPIITSVAQAPPLSPESKLTLQADIRANDIQALTFDNPGRRAGATDYTHPLVII